MTYRKTLESSSMLRLLLLSTSYLRKKDLKMD